MTVRPSMAERIARHNHDNALREHDENERVMRAIEHRRTQEEFMKWKAEIGFNLHLTAGQILFMLEDIRDDNLPKNMDDQGNRDFLWAVDLIPEARQFAEDTAMDCTEVKE